MLVAPSEFSEYMGWRWEGLTAGREAGTGCLWPPGDNTGATAAATRAASSRDFACAKARRLAAAAGKLLISFE